MMWLDLKGILNPRGRTFNVDEDHLLRKSEDNKKPFLQEKFKLFQKMEKFLSEKYRT